MNSRRGNHDGSPGAGSQRRLSGAAGALALAGVRAARRQHRRHHRPQRPARPAVDSGWQAGTCTERHADLQRRHPDQFFEQAAGHPPVGFTQFIVKHTNRGPAAKTGRRTEDRPRRPAGRAQRQPGGDRPLPARDLRSRRRRCPAASKVGTSFVTAARPAARHAAAGAADRSRRLQHRSADRASPPASGSNWPATKSSSKPTSPGTATTTRASRSPSRKRCRTAGLEGLILKNRLVFDGPPATAPSSPPPAPASARPSRAVGQHLLDLPARRLLRGRGKPRLRVPARAPRPRFESPIPPGTSPKECATIPYDPALDVDPGTAATDSPAGAAVDVDVPAHPRRRQRRTAPTPERGAGLAAGRDGDQPLGRQRPADLHRRPVRQGHQSTRPPARPASKVGTVDDRIAAAAGRLADRRRLRRPAAQPRPGLRQRVPDLRRRRVGPLRDLGAAGRQRQRRPA